MFMSSKNMLMSSALLLTLYTTQTLAALVPEKEHTKEVQACTKKIRERLPDRDCYWARIMDFKGKCATSPILCTKLKIAQGKYSQSNFDQDRLALAKKIKTLGSSEIEGVCEDTILKIEGKIKPIKELYIKLNGKEDCF